MIQMMNDLLDERTMISSDIRELRAELEDLIAEMERSGTAAAIRSEDGNLRYAYFLSLENPETVLNGSVTVPAQGVLLVVPAA